jgi:hypothetical protein
VYVLIDFTDSKQRNFTLRTSTTATMRPAKTEHIPEKTSFKEEFKEE